MQIEFFETPADLQAWFEKNSGNVPELWVGYYKTKSGRASVTWPESVDEALCVGWIDGIRKSLDESSYTIRFSPRKTASIWSAVNIRRAQALIEAGRMRVAGLDAFNARRENRSGIYSYEQRSDQLPALYAQKLGENRAAAEFFDAQPASYRKAANWWVVSAKQEATRLKRLAQLIDASAQGRTVPPLTRMRPARSKP